MIGFIIGCGRSGTHLLGQILHGEDAHVCFEEIFGFDKGHERTLHWSWVMAMARSYHSKQVRDRLWQPTMKAYREMRRLVERNNKIFIDKANQNFNFAEELQEEFPDAYFLGIRREVLPSVRSMINHGGFMQDTLYLSHSYDVPNAFSGAMSEEYFPLSYPQKMAWRWCASAQRLTELQGKLDNYMLLHYEDLVTDYDIERKKLELFLGIKTHNREEFFNTWGSGIENRNAGAEDELKEKFGSWILDHIYQGVDYYKELFGDFDE